MPVTKAERLMRMPRFLGVAVLIVLGVLCQGCTTNQPASQGKPQVARQMQSYASAPLDANAQSNLYASALVVCVDMKQAYLNTQAVDQGLTQAGLPVNSDT
jgi:hypothetical protein